LNLSLEGVRCSGDERLRRNDHARFGHPRLLAQITRETRRMNRTRERNRSKMALFDPLRPIVYYRWGPPLLR